MASYTAPLREIEFVLNQVLDVGQLAKLPAYAEATPETLLGLVEEAAKLVQQQIADCWIQLEQFRLLVLRTAWLIDRHHDYQKVRRDIAAVKVAMPQVLHDVAQRALHLHGALGVSDEMPFVKMMVAAESLGIADGATELHKMTVARRTLREYEPVTTPFPSQHIPTRRAEAQARLAERLEHAVAEF